jgi:hypothetical protein
MDRSVNTLSAAEREYQLWRVRNAERKRLLERRPVEVVPELTPEDMTFETPMVRALHEHACSLAREHKIRVQRRARGENNWGSKQSRTICCSPITDEASYGTFMHELGHVLDAEASSRRHPAFNRDGYRWSPKMEIAAWRYAIQHAATWTHAMQVDMFRSLESHDAFTIATGQDRVAMYELLAEGWNSIRRGTKWSFEELNERRARICSRTQFADAHRGVK